MSDKIIEEYYNNFNYPSYEKLFKILKADGHNISKKEIQEQLSKKEEVQQFKEVKKSKKKHGHIIAVAPNTQFQVDIYYMMKYYKDNKNYKYILACVDIFTRKLYCVPMKTKEIDEVVSSLTELFKEAGMPFVLTSDSDSTFLSKECQNFLNKNNVIHHTVPVGDHSSLGIIDRIARTLKTILHKRFLITKSLNWVDVLPTIVQQYNNSPHSSIDDIKPNQATTPENVSRIIDINNEKSNDISTYKNEFKVGDKVRIKIEGYNKKTEGQFYDKVYIVKETHGKTVLLDNDVIKKYDMLLKVHDDTVIAEPNNLIKKAKKDYKGELIRKKEDIEEVNIRVGTRERKKVEKLNL